MIRARHILKCNISNLFDAIQLLPQLNLLSQDQAFFSVAVLQTRGHVLVVEKGSQLFNRSKAPSFSQLYVLYDLEVSGVAGG